MFVLVVVYVMGVMETESVTVAIVQCCCTLLVFMCDTELLCAKG